LHHILLPLTSLKMLHMHHCYYLTMADELVVELVSNYWKTHHMLETNMLLTSITTPCSFMHGTVDVSASVHAPASPVVSSPGDQSLSPTHTPAPPSPSATGLTLHHPARLVCPPAPRRLPYSLGRYPPPLLCHLNLLMLRHAWSLAVIMALFSASNGLMVLWHGLLLVILMLLLIHPLSHPLIRMLLAYLIGVILWNSSFKLL
jgi:hypothetical protein